MSDFFHMPSEIWSSIFSGLPSAAVLARKISSSPALKSSEISLSDTKRRSRPAAIWSATLRANARKLSFRATKSVSHPISTIAAILPPAWT